MVAPLIYGTFLGGNHQDRPAATEVDGAHRAFVVGWTKLPGLSDHPLAPLDTSCGGIYFVTTVYVTSLSADGSVLSYSTFFGGSR